MEKIILFCFPYAGGSATIYIKWRTYLSSHIDLVPVEFAGRGRRINEPFYESMSDALDDLYDKVKPYLMEYKFAFFGHSMGGVFVYELCKKIKENEGKDPIHVFVSGRYPPHINKSEQMLHLLPDDKFKDAIIKIGGTPSSVFENPELSEIFIPILKADYRLIERYEYAESNFRFNCGLTVFNGRSDKIATSDEILEWQKYTTANLNIYDFEGAHFFIYNNTNRITEIINRILVM